MDKKQVDINVEMFIEQASELLNNSKDIYKVIIKGNKTDVVITKPKENEEANKQESKEDV